MLGAWQDLPTSATMLRAFSLLAVLFAAQVHALPWTNATCVNHLWSLNTYQQSPCLVSAYLSAECTNDNTWGVLALTNLNGGYYAPPTKEQASNCQCNSVTWNLLSACSLCQGASSGSWGEWITNCTNPAVGKYILPLPSGVAVPHWAYYDFTVTGVFNPVTASQQSGPESVAVPSPTASSEASATGTAPPATSSSPAVESSSKPNNTGAIVGGVVGGILGLVLIGVLGFVLLRKGKTNTADAPAVHYTQEPYSPTVGSQPNSAAPMMGQFQAGVQRPGMVSPSDSQFKPSDSSAYTNSTHNPTPYQSLPYNLQPPPHSRPNNAAPYT